ncbi:UNVERIFIED_CONTAM: hypothetical protein K2H54_000167 [Gekko kuhli]
MCAASCSFWRGRRASSSTSADIELENLVPVSLRKVLRYVARFEHDGKARVGLEALEPHHPFANLLPCDNIFAIESDSYRTNPLVIQGPGAGREVTAAAIQYDLWQICASL